MADDPQELNGIEKASLLLMALGATVSAQVFKHLSEGEIERLSTEIVRTRQVEPQVMQAVVDEFHQAYAADLGGLGDGKDFASQVLEQVVGRDKAEELIQKAGGMKRGRVFACLKSVDPGRISAVLGAEHPQIIALVLSHIAPDRAAQVISRLDESVRSEVALRICSTGAVSPDVLEVIDDILSSRLSSTDAAVEVAAGPKILAEILNMAERSTERAVLEVLHESQPEMGEQVRGMMFLFEDLVRLEDRMVQIVLREIDQEDLRTALKGAEDEIKEIIFRNMSERAAEALKEDLELTGAAKARDIESAQQRIVGVVKELLATGKIDLETSEPEEQSA